MWHQSSKQIYLLGPDTHYKKKAKCTQKREMCVQDREKIRVYRSECDSGEDSHGFMSRAPPPSSSLTMSERDVAILGLTTKEIDINFIVG